ncbi:MAG: sigma factor-like helix-turn-helix DNA-binding protein [Roseiarcus sp.]
MLACWLVENQTDAEGVVAEAFRLAFAETGLSGDFNARTLVLAAVRRTARDWLRQNRAAEVTDVEIDEPERNGSDLSAAKTSRTAPLTADPSPLEAAIAALPAPFRETIVLRDILGLSHREIADLTQTQMGAAPKRLAEARERLLETGAWIASAHEPSACYEQISNRRDPQMHREQCPHSQN